MFFNKVLKTVSRVWFCCEHLLLKYRDSIDHFLELRSTIVLLNSRRFKVVPRAFSACRDEIQMSIRISDDQACKHLHIISQIIKFLLVITTVRGESRIEYLWKSSWSSSSLSSAELSLSSFSLSWSSSTKSIFLFF